MLEKLVLQTPDANIAMVEDLEQHSTPPYTTGDVNKCQNETATRIKSELR